MPGVKSTAVFLSVNATIYYASPSSAPYVFGLTVVPWLAYLVSIIMLAIVGTVAYWIADRDDPEKAEEFRENFTTSKK
jgi:4-hydroxybenzoate polyprenyltransferase